MKMFGRVKLVVFLTLAGVYFSGLLTWIYQHWFFVQTPFGSEPAPAAVYWLDGHSVTGLWFLIVFGYLVHSHLEPGWRRHKKRRSGGAFTLLCAILILTVPGLFYLTQATLRSNVSLLHTYLGLGSVLFFLLHFFSPTERSRR